MAFNWFNSNKSNNLKGDIKMACKYKTYFDIIVSDKDINKAEQYFKRFDIEVLGIAPINPYDNNSDYRIRFLNIIC